MNMMRSRTEKITYVSVLTAAGLILSYLESFIVIPVSIPGIRIGLANISTLLALYMFGPVYALCVTVIRIILASVLFQTPISFIYGISGALLALLGMMISRRTGFSVYGVSVTGAVLHNFAQTVVASAFVGNIYVFSVFPVLAASAVVAGLLTGLVASALLGRLKGIYSINKDKESDTYL